MTLCLLHFFFVSLHDRKEPVALSATCQMTVNSHLSCQEAPTLQVLQDEHTRLVLTHRYFTVFKNWNFTKANWPLCCFASINIENNSSVSWVEFINKGKFRNVSLLNRHAGDSLNFTTIKISSRKALTWTYSPLSCTVTNVSVFPQGVVIIRVSVRGAFSLIHSWVRGSDIFPPEQCVFSPPGGSLLHSQTQSELNKIFYRGPNRTFLLCYEPAQTRSKKEAHIKIILSNWLK